MELIIDKATSGGPVWLYGEGGKGRVVVAGMGLLDNLGSPDAVGSVISIISSIISNVGVNAQKRVHVKNEKKPLAERTPYFRKASWWVGLSLVVLGAIGDFIALGIASQALVTALGGGTTLAVNIAIAKFWLDEELAGGLEEEIGSDCSKF